MVIDEAGMAGTRSLAPVLDVAAQAGAKVVLVGDPRQLPEIDAGGVLAGLASRLGATELVGNRRQREVWERDALAELRDGDVDSALGAYQRNGRVVTGTTALEVRQRLVADWWSYRLSGDAVAMVAFRRNDVDDLNGRARAYLQRSGDLTGPELVVAVDEKHRLNRVLKACPPDRTHDLASLSQRRAQIATDLEPLVGRHNELAARKLRGPTARQGLRDLRGTIADRSAALDRIDTELDQVREAVSARSRFQNDHTPDSALLTAVEHEIDRHIARRVEAWTSAPSDHHLAVLGPLRSDPAGRAAWIRGASILEGHHLGADDDPSNPRPRTLLGAAKDLARTRAQLEILGVPPVD